jgi:hypothetical protein
MVCSNLTAVGVNVGANQEPRIGCGLRGKLPAMTFWLDAAQLHGSSNTDAMT